MFKPGSSFRRLRTSQFVRHVAILTSGTAAAQIITILAVPLIARLYTPGDFGVFALFLAFSSIGGAIATARYEMAIVLPSRDDDARSIVVLSILIALFVSGATLVAIIAMGEQLAAAIQNDKLSRWMIFIPLGVLLTGIFQSLYYWHIRKERLKRVAANRVVQSSSVVAAQLGGGVVNAGPVGLVLGTIIGQCIGVFLLARSFWKHDKPDSWTQCFAGIRANGRRYISFPKYGAPAILTSSAAQQSLFFLISEYLGSVVLGYVYLINRVVYLPASLIGGAIGDVFYQSISRIPKQDSYPIVSAFVKKLLAYSVTIYIGLYVLMEALFVTIFGEEWAGAVWLIKYFTLVGCLSFVFAPMSVLFNYFEIQGINFIWQLAWLVTNIAVFFVGHAMALQMQEVVMIYALKQAILYVIGIVGFLLVAKRCGARG